MPLCASRYVLWAGEQTGGLELGEVEGIATLGCHYHFATILDICVKPICRRGAGQGQQAEKMLLFPGLASQ